MATCTKGKAITLPFASFFVDGSRVSIFNHELFAFNFHNVGKFLYCCDLIIQHYLYFGNSRHDYFVFLKNMRKKL